MSKQLRYIARLLLLLYIGYSGCVSYFVHMHVYNGVVYVHSHPYNKAAKNNDDGNEPPFETHQHTAAGFFTLNQLSSITSFDAPQPVLEDVITTLLTTIPYKQIAEQPIIEVIRIICSNRAPPFHF